MTETDDSWQLIAETWEGIAVDAETQAHDWEARALKAEATVARVRNLASGRDQLTGREVMEALGDA